MSASTRHFVRHYVQMVVARSLGIGALLIVGHVAMPLAMLGVMLLRPAEYTGHAHHRAHAGHAVPEPMTT